MAEGLTSAALVGCTGLVVSPLNRISSTSWLKVFIHTLQGSQILATLLSLSPTPSIQAIARNQPAIDSTHVKAIISKDNSTWAESLKSIQPAPKAFVSALATTTAQAGSFEAKYAIDYDLNLSLARAAKEAGTDIYVLISSAGISKTSLFPYSRMKAELEEAVKSVGFQYTVLVRPGLLVGNRSESRPAEGVLKAVAKGLGSVSKTWLADWWAQDVDVIGRAVVAATMECAESKRKPGVWEVDQAEIIKLGRTNWKGVT